MKKTKKAMRIIAMFLVLTLCLPFIFACNSDEKKDDPTGESNSNASNNDTSDASGEDASGEDASEETTPEATTEAAVVELPPLEPGKYNFVDEFNFLWEYVTDNAGLGTFGDVNNEVEKIVTEDGLEVTRILLGDYLYETNRIVLICADTGALCEEFDSAVTYKFPYPIVDWSFGGISPIDNETVSYYHTGCFYFFSKEPVDYTKLPADLIELPAWEGPLQSGSLSADDGYYYLTIIGAQNPVGWEDRVKVASLNVTVEVK